MCFQLLFLLSFLSPQINHENLETFITLIDYAAHMLHKIIRF